MKVTDLDEILKIEQESFNPAWSRESFLYEILKSAISNCIVTKYKDVVCGYGVGWKINNEYYIGTLAVKKEYRNQGIATLMLNHIITESSNECDMITLEVRESNLPAQKLYKKFGFKLIAIRKGYYPNNKEDALVMMCELNKCKPAVYTTSV